MIIHHDQWDGQELNLPLITISSHSKYIRHEDLIEWENGMIDTGFIQKNKIL